MFVSLLSRTGAEFNTGAELNAQLFYAFLVWPLGGVDFSDFLDFQNQTPEFALTNKLSD
jgi:hypothetical protein